MAAITWFLTNNSVSVGSDLSLTDPGTEAYRSPVTGWISYRINNHSEWYNDVSVLPRRSLALLFLMVHSIPT
jgi:hypothetical protein